MTRKLMRIRTSLDVLQSLATQGHTLPKATIRCIIGLPADANYVSSYFDNRTFEGWLIFHSESFAPVLDGAEIPELVVIHRDEVKSYCPHCGALLTDRTADQTPPTP